MMPSGMPQGRMHNFDAQKAAGIQALTIKTVKCSNPMCNGHVDREGALFRQETYVRIVYDALQPDKGFGPVPAAAKWFCCDCGWLFQWDEAGTFRGTIQWPPKDDPAAPKLEL